MAETFIPKLDILPPSQRALWSEFSALPKEFTLYGGTAIALHLGHRASVDFDFFALQNIDPQTLLQTVGFLKDARNVEISVNTLNCSVDRRGSIKLSFFGLPKLSMVKPPLVSGDNGLRVASLLDLAGHKAVVVQARAEAKDFIDIDAILQRTGITLRDALDSASVIYGVSFNPFGTLKALTYFEDGNLAGLPADVKKRLTHSVKGVA